MRLDDGSELTVTATIGGTVQVRGTAARSPDVVGRADRALYAGEAPRPRPRAARQRPAPPATPRSRRLRPPAHRAGARAGRLDPRGRARAPLPAGGRPRRPAPPSTSRLPAAAVLRRAPRRLAARRRQDRHPGRHPRQARRARRGRVGGDARPSRGGRRGRAPRAGLDLASAAVGAAPRALGRHGLPGRARSGDEIALEARIVACADAYSAITSDRVYRPERSRAARASTSCGAARARISTRGRGGAGRRAGVRRGPLRRAPGPGQLTVAGPRTGPLAMLSRPRAWRNR